MLGIFMASFYIEVTHDVISLDIQNNNLPFITAVCCLQSAFPCIASVHITALRGRNVLLLFSSSVDEQLRVRGVGSTCQRLRVGCGGSGLESGSSQFKHDALAATLSLCSL